MYKTIRKVGVDAGMIIIADASIIQKGKNWEQQKRHIFNLKNGTYRVEYEIPHTWNGRQKGQGKLIVTSGKVVVTDPCYIIGRLTEDEQPDLWIEWLRKVYANWDDARANGEGLRLNRVYLQEQGIIIIDTMGGDGFYKVNLDIEEVK